MIDLTPLYLAMAALQQNVNDIQTNINKTLAYLDDVNKDEDEEKETDDAADDEAEILLIHLGVTVYHCYTDQGMVSECWYTVDPANCNTDSDDGSGTQFEVSDIRAATDVKFSNDASAIRYAIYRGWLTEEGLTVRQTDIPEEVGDGHA